ncbi:MAG: NUDIX hydrolase [Oscillospiraceae bacterium]|nr:NUDIX hydrolase [Oscillospiraceae bacterium]MDD4412996.1 NUDIX hydrolase [Oscillospiraceae bacterium]
MNLSEKTLSENILFTGNIISLNLDEVELPNGKTATREVVKHPGGVCVAALNDDDRLLFVRQYRYPYGELLLELPAGKLSPGEDPLECGKRELKEETGATAEHYESLGCLYPSPGYCGEIIHMFYASGLSYGDMKPDEDEFLEVEHIPLEKAVQMVLDNEITDAKTQTAVLKVAEKRRRDLL